MTEPPLWIVVRNWEKFQHYSYRRPLWIKTYIDLLHDYNYTRLSDSCRGILHGIWLLYASTNAQVPLNTAFITRQLNVHRVSRKQLETLRDAGFITFEASPLLAHCYPNASPEKRQKVSSPGNGARGAVSGRRKSAYDDMPDYPVIPEGEAI